MDVIINVENCYLLLLLALIVSIPACLFFLVRLREAIHSSRRLPPSAYAWQVVCNMSMSPLGSLANLAQIYGPIFSLRVGALLIIVASSPKTAMEILKARYHMFSGRYIPSLYYRIPRMEQSSVLGAKECNDGWKYMRAMCHNWLLSVKAIKLRNEVRERKMMELADYLHAKEGEIVTIRDVVFATLANSMGNMMVSRDLIDLERECKSGNQSLMGFIGAMLTVLGSPSLVDLFPILNGLLGFWERRKAKKLHQEFKSLWEEVIEERRQAKCTGEEPSQDLLDALIDNGFCNDKICALLMEMLVAGTFISCSTIEWLMVELIKNQGVLHKLRNEIENTGDGDIKNASSRHMPYLKACLKETLRLHPPKLFVLPRRALETCTVNNYVIPKDSVILINIWALGRDPMTWDEPLKFKPKRFLESQLELKGNVQFEFIPFGGGRRMCPGFNVATTHIQGIVALLVHCFDWFLPEGINPDNLNMTEKFGTTVYMKEPLSLIPRSRIP
ncbi:putative (S)-N-methylcoclaurine 3'-hydroxylase isozyme 2 [Sesamum alatum]|uniref:(S)-N-methylcoclaurine 3'-hydroxylase isozyme 2 n=1 Tax=Sesamum alatum TaxID=300844 RepID=A0AAE2CRF3_9LAMI|nr:putative (S)-N-methylcoclaurine 3'-hydroxylase isozyme 2 [Sesamum alatum]